MIEDDFRRDFDGMKGATHFTSFLSYVADMNNGFKDDYKYALDCNCLEENMDDLIKFCKNNNIKLVFVSFPQYRNELYNNDLKELCQHISQKWGVPVFEMMGKGNDIGLDPAHDYYDSLHTNIHGAIKTIDFLAEYLIDTYGLQDKRGKQDFSDWEKAYKKYSSLLSEYALPFEYTENNRQYNLDIPIICNQEGRLSWKSVEGSNGYGIFEKNKNGAWMLSYVVDEKTCHWEDTEYSNDKKYTVVAFSRVGEVLSWGNLDIYNNG